MSEPKPMDEYTRGLFDARGAYAKVLTDVLSLEISALDFTPDRLRAELQARWFESRSLADGTAPAVGQRVVTVREVADRWGLSHGHDDHVHEITSVLGRDTHLVECGPRQIGVGMLRLAPAGSDVTCPACRGWHEERERWRIDAQVYRETQFKVAELTADRDRHAKRADRAEARLAASESEHLTEISGLVSNAAAVREQHSNRVDRLLRRIETLEAEAADLRARVPVEAEDPS